MHTVYGRLYVERTGQRAVFRRWLTVTVAMVGSLLTRERTIGTLRPAFGPGAAKLASTQPVTRAAVTLMTNADAAGRAGAHAAAARRVPIDGDLGVLRGG